MAQKGVGYEYQFVDLPNDATKEEVLALLNKLGEEGWWLVSVDNQNPNQDNIWGSAWMMRAKS